MINKLQRHMIQFYEECKRDGLASTMHEFIYLNREAVILARDLPSFGAKVKNIPIANIEFVEICADNFNQINPIYPLKFRYLKAMRNLNNGYKSFAVLSDRKVMGDFWYTTFDKSSNSIVHPDLKWLGIALEKRDVYATDTYVPHEERGNVIARFLWNCALTSLKDKGFNKVYGYVWADNIPALWLYRILKFKDVKKIKMNRFIYFQIRGFTK